MARQRPTIHKLFTGKVTTALAIVLLGIAPVVSTPAQADDQISFSTSSYGFLYIPAFVADELGYFADNGIDVEFHRTGSGSSALAAAVSGDSQFYLGPVSSAAVARENGVDVVAVGAINQQYDANVAISGTWAKKFNLTEDSSFEDRLAALKGARIAVTSPGSGTDQLARYLAKTAGLDPDRDFTIVPISGAESMVAAFNQDRIDGYIISTPMSNMAVLEHDGFMLFHTAKGEVPDLRGFIYSAVVTLDDWAKQNEDIVVRTLRALQSGLDALHDPALSSKAKDLVRAEYYSSFSPDVFDTLWADALASYPTTVKATQDQIEQAVKFTNEFGGTTISAEVAKSVLADSYAEKALGEN